MRRSTLLLIAATYSAVAGAWWNLPELIVPPTGCANLSSVPVRYNINYNVDIQAIFDLRCADCHVDPVKPPFAGLDLDAPNSWYYLVDQPSTQEPTLTRVIAGDPLNSLLLRKVNCTTPPIGVGMPKGRPQIPIAEQALIYDWIAGGAAVDASDGIFRDAFQGPLVRN